VGDVDWDLHCVVCLPDPVHPPVSASDLQPSATPPQSVEIQASRQQDEKELSLEQGQRVFLHVNPKTMMSYEQHEIESAPIL
jgi:hypothetical protein